MKRTPIGIGQRSLRRGSTFEKPRSELRRTSEMKPGVSRARKPSFTPASKDQRLKVAGQLCLVLGTEDSPCGGPIDPAHLIDRALGGTDDPRCVVPLCRLHHDAYDQGELSILEYLEPRYRVELAYAVELVGLLPALRQLTGERWAPETKR